ncbi:MAG: acetyltransferase, partial [Candidatus Methanofastidiosa archaeon]|nr:acetyltransferase [Candidatus Methanofastidiosa archaeon]
MKNKTIIVGMFHEIIELAESSGVEIFGGIDNYKIGDYRNIKVICTDEMVYNLGVDYKKYDLIITPDNPKVREKLFHHYSKLGFRFGKLISKKAEVSKSASIGCGTIIQNGVNISAEVQIGRFVKLNTMCNIMHNSFIGDYSTIAPNAVILGNVSVESRCYIGANSTILPNLVIGENSIIGAGAVV